MPLVPRAARFASTDVGPDRQAPRRYRLLLLPSPQSYHDRRRWNAHHFGSRVRPQVQAAAAARHERPGYRAARLCPGDFRRLPHRRLQLPDDRHPGRSRRKQLDELPDSCPSPGAIAARYAELLGNVEELKLAIRAGMGPVQLAKLLRAPAEPGRSEGR